MYLSIQMVSNVSYRYCSLFSPRGNVFFFHQTNDHATRRRSSAARMGAAFRSCGCVTSTTIAEMTRTNRLTCVARETVPPAGPVVLDNPTTVAFPSGCSVMARTTAGMVAMNCRRTVPSATPRRTTGATTIAVFRSEFCPTPIFTTQLNIDF